MSADEIRLHQPDAELEADDLAEVNGPDEVDQTLAVLRGLLDSVTSPVVRATLEEAIEDIEHLAGREAA